MRAIKRVGVLSIELISEAVLLGCLLGILVAGQIGLVYGIVGSVLAVPVILFLHAYYLTRSLAGVILRIRTRWVYPTTVTALFVIHMSFALARSKSDLTPFARATELPFLTIGACIVFACAFAGDRLLSKWTHRSANGPNPTVSGDPQSSLDRSRVGPLRL